MQEETSAFQRSILALIPQEIWEDVPPQKTEEFQRGVLRYLSWEAPELSQSAESAGELSGELRERLTEKTCQFSELVRAKKKHGGM